MKIGIFDSGIGGLSVLHHALKVIPNAHFIYYADMQHVPYGEKTEIEVRGFVEKIINFFIKQGVDAIVIACNTASSVATKEYRDQYPIPIIGMEPAVKKAVKLYPDEKKRILVAATPITIEGNKLHNLLDRVDMVHNIDLIALPMLVRFAECGDFDSKAIDEYLKDSFKGYSLKDYSSIVLGCTHFNYFKVNFQSLFPNYINFVDGNEGTVNQLIRKLQKANPFDPQLVDYYFSGKRVKETERQYINSCLERLEKMYII